MADELGHKLSRGDEERVQPVYEFRDVDLPDPDKLAQALVAFHNQARCVSDYLLDKKPHNDSPSSAASPTSHSSDSSFTTISRACPTSAR
jgi:hypothetical protein